MGDLWLISISKLEYVILSARLQFISPTRLLPKRSGVTNDLLKLNEWQELFPDVATFVLRGMCFQAFSFISLQQVICHLPCNFLLFFKVILKKCINIVIEDEKDTWEKDKNSFHFFFLETMIEKSSSN